MRRTTRLTWRYVTALLLCRVVARLPGCAATAAGLWSRYPVAEPVEEWVRVVVMG
ncbi:hypothetical protein [Kribbella deserti]|uniref:Uncharacterized protein n=1 Tax=Kribbella deserti TaxID=1926257 RepID=A0ABV6QMW6_9ACTN